MTVPFHDPLWVQKKITSLSKKLGWKKKHLATIGKYPITALFSSAPSPSTKHVYLSAGIHGDEPAGVLALIEWLENLASAPSHYQFTVIPLINPWGLKHNSRLNEQGIDLNRAFHKADLSPIKEIRLFLENRTPFDLALILHEDYDAHGVYLYETPANLCLGKKILEEVSKLCAIDTRPKIEGRKHNGGVLSRPVKKSWFEKNGYPEAIYFYFQLGCKKIYTIETPSEWDIAKRVQAHLSAINTALSLLNS
ncbi:deacylase [Methylacidiphilum kamchatkense Kam1]|uniref:Deacylase n=1 Tax=Methylacidiphilum kamchatkense Kam1 TaxID=1202785 RepID=A0A0C1USG4_9BACT|nr:M14 family metallocarboxypeptidase [Methylacidiphilum kamchatkense]KIE59224.1 deacylase [Methylacidiphilum kamchatkense Kam1]QDQ42815.1 succinylglutamate desuccinylase/aspartoacylase family protein [Methylacidiphilum kamchatkense Kam1]